MDNKPKDSLPERLLTVKEVAFKLSISQSKVYLLLGIGEIPAIQIGRSKRIDPADLASFIERCKSESNQGRLPSQVDKEVYN